MRKLKIAFAALLVVLIAGCTGDEASPTSQAMCMAEQSLVARFAMPDVPAPTADDWSRGAADAEITVIVYSDFQ